jgi:hypothetical protein
LTSLISKDKRGRRDTKGNEEKLTQAQKALDDAQKKLQDYKMSCEQEADADADSHKLQKTHSEKEPGAQTKETSHATGVENSKAVPTQGTKRIWSFRSNKS